MSATALANVPGPGGAHAFPQPQPAVADVSWPGLEANIVESDQDWDRLIATNPAATAFHSSAWSRVLCDTYGHQPIRLRFSKKGTTTALLPLLEVRSAITGRRGISLPFSDFCPPLFFSGGGGGWMIEKLRALAEERRWKYFELRGAPFLRSSAPAAVRFYGHTLELSGDVEARFSPTAARNVRKAERSGVAVTLTRDRGAVMEFYRLLARTRRRHGLPPQSLNFFLKIHEHLLESGLGFFAIAKRQQQPIAGAIFFRFGGNALFKYGASDERAQEFRANNLVMRDAIRELAATGARTLHFGRTACHNDGLRRFKLAWGAEEEMIDYFRFERARGSWSTAEPDLAGKAASLFRKMPLPLNRLIGTMVYPHLD